MKMKGIKIRTGAKLLIFVQPSVYTEEGANPTMTTIDSINRVCSNLAWNVALTWTCVWMLISMVRADQTQSHNLTATALWPFDPAELGWASAFTEERRDLLKQPQDFYEPDVLPATQPIVSKHYRKTQWSGCLLFYHIYMVSASHVQPNSVKALKEAKSRHLKRLNFSNQPLVPTLTLDCYWVVTCKQYNITIINFTAVIATFHVLSCNAHKYD